LARLPPIKQLPT